jgi:hypothetical protein
MKFDVADLQLRKVWVESQSYMYFHYFITIKLMFPHKFYMLPSIYRSWPLLFSALKLWQLFYCTIKITFTAIIQSDKLNTCIILFKLHTHSAINGHEKSECKFWKNELQANLRIFF